MKTRRSPGHGRLLASERAGAYVAPKRVTRDRLGRRVEDDLVIVCSDCEEGYIGLRKNYLGMEMTVETKAVNRPSARPLYIASDLARLSQTTPAKARRWLCGYSVSGRDYQPFLRTPELTPTDQHVFTFDNLIELSLVSKLRKEGLSLPLVREAYKVAEREFGPYPFARRPVFVSGKDLFMKASDYVRAEAEHLATLTKGNQRALEPTLEAYLTRVEWENEWPVGWEPIDFVSLNPELAFGQPNVRGVRTEILRARFLAGETMEFLAEDFGLELDEVQAAVRYELILEAAA